MRRIHTEDVATIPAEPAVVWRVLTDFDRYPDWWPSSVRIRVLQVTPTSVGSAFEIKPYRGRGFRCDLVGIRDGTELRFAYSGLYRGSGVWSLHDAGSEGTRVAYAIDLEIVDRLTATLSRVLPIGRLHSRLMKDVFGGLTEHVAARAGEPADPPVTAGSHVGS